VTDKAWKAFERHLARDVETERIPVTGERDGADFEDGRHVYQVKLGRRLPASARRHRLSFYHTEARMQFHYERLRVPDVPFIVMEDTVFSDGQLWTVFHDRNASRFWIVQLWIVQLDGHENVVGFVSVPIEDLPICAAKAADWAELYADYSASPSD